MKSFDDWFKELTSDTRWVELLRHYKDDTIKKAGEKVFAQLVADSTVEVRPMSENRKHVYNILIKAGPGDKPLPKPFQVQEAEKKEAEKEAKEILTYTKEHADRCAAEALEIIRNSKTLNYFPKVTHKQAVEEGDWIPKKDKPWPVTTPEEAYVRDRHFEWIKNNFEARTGQKLPSWIDEESWNIIYDENHLTDKGL